MYTVKCMRLTSSLAFIAVLAVVALFMVGIYFIFGFPYRSSSTEPRVFHIREGLRLVYELSPAGREPGISRYLIDTTRHDVEKSLNVSSTIDRYYFYFVLHPSYGELVDSFAENNSVYLDKEKLCEVVSKRLLLVVEVLDMASGRATVKLTLAFIDGYARCGHRYAPLPAVDSRWIGHGKRLFASFNSLNISRTLIVRQSDHDVVSDDGERYGEWTFWIDEKLLNQSYVVLLYGLDDLVKVGYSSERELRGIAYLLLIGSSRVAPRDYIVGDMRFRGPDQVYAGGLEIPALPIERTVSNITEGAAKQVVRKLLDKWRDLERVAALFPIIYEPEVRRLTLFRDLLPEIANLEGRAWEYVPAVTRYCLSENINGTFVKFCENHRGIVYNGHAYLAFINVGLEEASYLRNGVLLFARFRAPNGAIYGALPSALTRSFGILHTSRIGGSEISMSLIEVSSTH